MCQCHTVAARRPLLLQPGFSCSERTPWLVAIKDTAPYISRWNAGREGCFFVLVSPVLDSGVNLIHNTGGSSHMFFLGIWQSCWFPPSPVGLISCDDFESKFRKQSWLCILLYKAWNTFAPHRNWWVFEARFSLSKANLWKKFKLHCPE